MLANKESVLKSLDLFSDNLARLREAVEAGDSGVLLGVFSRAKEARDEFTSVMAASGKQKNSHKD
jgi:3-phosphoshikimate 1-carboxyvinyltransferase